MKKLCCYIFGVPAKELKSLPNENVLNRGLSQALSELGRPEIGDFWFNFSASFAGRLDACLQKVYDGNNCPVIRVLKTNGDRYIAVSSVQIPRNKLNRILANSRIMHKILPPGDFTINISAGSSGKKKRLTLRASGNAKRDHAPVEVTIAQD